MRKDDTLWGRIGYAVAFVITLIGLGLTLGGAYFFVSLALVRLGVPAGYHSMPALFILAGIGCVMYWTLTGKKPLQ